MEELFKKIGIEPNNLSLYKLAFTHSSYVNEKEAKVKLFFWEILKILKNFLKPKICF